jgi:hypothetical protein
MSYRDHPSFSLSLNRARMDRIQAESERLASEAASTMSNIISAGGGPIEQPLAPVVPKKPVQLRYPAMKRTRVVIESPFKTLTFNLPGEGDPHVQLTEPTNVEYARAAAHDCLVNHNESPWASHLLYTQEGILDDSIAEERTAGIEAGMVWSVTAEKCVVYIDRGITLGMREYGIPGAIKNGVEVEYRRLGGKWTIPALADLSIETLMALPIAATSTRLPFLSLVGEQGGTLWEIYRKYEDRPSEDDYLHGGNLRLSVDGFGPEGERLAVSASLEPHLNEMLHFDEEQFNEAMEAGAQDRGNALRVDGDTTTLCHEVGEFSVPTELVAKLVKGTALY